MASRSANRSSPSETVLVGEVLRPHGLRGDLKIEVWSDVPDRFAVGRELFLVTGPTDASQRELVRVASFRQLRPGVALVHFDGFCDRDRAEAARGGRIEVDVAQVPEAPPGLYYYHELVGCRCIDESHGDLGTVRDVIEDGGGVLLQVEGPAAGDAGSSTGNGSRLPERSLLVPFVESFLAEVDVAGRRIDLRLPPGLVEICGSRS